MPWNTSLPHSLPFYHPIGFFINLLILTLHNKMGYVAEWKNRLLVETARTLLLQHIVPQHFKGDTILTVCYLINCMPSSVLGDQVPHSFLFPNQPLFCLPPLVFGCTCFVYILTPGQDKLYAKAMKCIFLSYSHLQSGYRCYSLDTHQYFVSINVTFFENSSIFSTPLPSSPEVLSLPLIFPIPALSSMSPATPPLPLQVYTCRPCTDTEPPDDSSLTAPSSTMPVLPSPADPLIPIRKGTCSSHNPHPIYNFLSYHRLSSPYLLLFPHCLLFLFLTLYKRRPSLIRDGNMQWLKKWLLCILLAHGT